MNLLLIDDEPLMLEMLADAVEEVLPTAVRGCFTTAKEGLAYAAEKPIDIAFLDINLTGGTNGLELAEKLVGMYPRVNIIFCTGYGQYAMDAFKLYASGYLQKPIWPESIRNAVAHLRYPVKPPRRLRIQCFGNFEAWCDGKPVVFERRRTMELLAYLVDRKGAECSTQEIISVLFEDDVKRRYYSYLRSDLINTFERLGISDCLLITHGSLGVVREKVDCDFFDFLDGRYNHPPKEYMTQYSFGEVTFGSLLE